MNAGKRKSEECHYCENQKRHERKRSKLAIDVQSKPNLVVGSVMMLSNFKCRGRGGKEIEFPPLPSSRVGIAPKTPKTAAGAVAGGVVTGKTPRSNCLKPNANFKPQFNAEPKPLLLDFEDPRFTSLSCASRSEGRCSSGLRNEIGISKKYKLKFGSSVDEFSEGSDKKPRLDLEATKFRSDSPLPHRPSRDPLISDEQLSSGSSVSCLSLSRNTRKFCNQASTTSLTSAAGYNQKQANRYSRSLTEESKRLRASSETVHDYLISVTEELQKNQLLGNFDRRDQFPEKSISDGVGERLTVTGKLKRLPSSATSAENTSKKQRFGNTKSCPSGQSFITRSGATKFLKRDTSFWARLLRLFSWGCWKTDIHSNSPSEERKSEASTVSGSDESTSSESSSTSTGTTTVAAVAACGRLSATMKSDDGKNPSETPTAKTVSSKSSCSGEHKLMAAKLVESLKRFFSRHRKSDSDRPFDASESSSNSSTTTSSAENISEHYLSAPLNPKKSSLNLKQPLELQLTVLPNRRNCIKSKHERECLVQRLLDGESAESPLSTENERSDAEIVDVCPMHKQPL